MSNVQQPFKELHPVDQLFPFRIHHNQHTFSFPPHYHRELEVLYVKKGHLSVEVNHTLYSLREGDVLIIGSHHIHSYKNKDHMGDSDNYMLIFDWTYLESLGKDQVTYGLYSSILLQTNHFKAKDHPLLSTQIQGLFDQMTHEYQSDALGNKLMIMAHLYIFLTSALRALNTFTIPNTDSKQLEKSHALIHKVNRLITLNYTRTITLAEAAQTAGYSQYHFTRIFKEQTNFTFKEYLNNFRINMVKETLVTSKAPITEIAFHHGFNSLKSFNRNFKTITGMTPSDYKKSLGDPS